MFFAIHISTSSLRNLPFSHSPPPPPDTRTHATCARYPPSSSTPASHPLGRFGSADLTPPSSSSIKADEHPSTPSAALDIRNVALLSKEEAEKRRSPVRFWVVVGDRGVGPDDSSVRPTRLDEDAEDELPVVVERRDLHM